MRDNRAELTLYVPDANGLDFLFTAIDVAYRLATGTLGGVGVSVRHNRIRIVRVPSRRTFAKHFFYHILHFFHLMPTFLERALLATLPDVWRQQFDYPREGMYVKIERGISQYLEVNDVGVSIEVHKLPLPARARLAVTSNFHAIHLWLHCLSAGSFNPQLFLGLEHRGVKVGPAAASETLRVDVSMGGALVATFALYRALVSAIWMCEVADAIKVDGGSENFVMVPEATYLPSVYQFALANRGMGVISLYSYEHIFKLEDRHLPHDGSMFAKRTDVKKLSQSEFNEYMSGRLTNPQHYLSYMGNWMDEGIGHSIVNRWGLNLDLSRDSIVVVVFLHSFSDSQYYFGLDGFNDLFHWTTFTIDHCLANGNVDRVLVKPHPAIDLKFWPSDRLALKRLRERYEAEPRCIFIDAKIPITTLASERKAFGITHHGSVAEEFVYLGQPVIGSTCAPWGRHYHFLRTWRDPKEYADILSALSSESWEPPGPDERAELELFVGEFRRPDMYKMNQVSFLAFVAWLDNKVDLEWECAYHHYSSIVRRLSVDDPKLGEYLHIFLTRPLWKIIS